MTTSLPVFKPLTSTRVKQIDQTGRRILARIGIRIKDSTFLKKLEEAGAQVNYENQRVRFSGERLDMLLSRAAISGRTFRTLSTSSSVLNLLRLSRRLP